MTTSSDEGLETLRAHFDSLQIGATATYDVRFSDETVAEYVGRAQITYPGRYVDAAGQPIVPPGLLFVGPAAVFGLKTGPRGAQGGIFTETERQYRSPVRVGECVRFEGTITAKFLQRGRYYIEVTWRAFAESGAEAASGKELHTLGMVREPLP